MSPRAPRKNLMLAATITGGGVCVPVRIRNLSASGAMIDGPALPETGSTLALTRLEMSVGATVVWNEGGRCGLRLNGEVNVEHWIAGAPPAMPRASLGQMRVDQIQGALRRGAAMISNQDMSAPTVAGLESIDARIAAELANVTRMLDAVSDDLIEDASVLVRHGPTLQSLDIAIAIVRSLAEVMSADEPETAISALAMHDLRSRLSGRLTLM